MDSITIIGLIVFVIVLIATASLIYLNYKKWQKNENSGGLNVIRSPYRTVPIQSSLNQPYIEIAPEQSYPIIRTDITKNNPALVY